MNVKKYLSAELILVVGLAYVFLAFGYQKIFLTEYWVGWMPLWLDGFLGLSTVLWTKIVGVAEIVIGLAVLYPRIRKIAALLMVLNLIVVVYITGFTEIGIRDTGLLLAAVALFYMKL